MSKKGEESLRAWEICKVEQIILWKIIEKFSLLKVSDNLLVLQCVEGLILYAK